MKIRLSQNVIKNIMRESLQLGYDTNQEKDLIKNNDVKLLNKDQVILLIQFFLTLCIRNLILVMAMMKMMMMKVLPIRKYFIYIYVHNSR